MVSWWFKCSMASNVSCLVPWWFKCSALSQNLTQGAQPQIVQLQAPQAVVQQLGQMQQVQQVVTPVSVQQQQQPTQQTAVVSQLPTQVAAAAAQPTIVQPTTQVFQQVITPSGEVQSIPVSTGSSLLVSVGWLCRCPGMVLLTYDATHQETLSHSHVSSLSQCELILV